MKNKNAKQLLVVWIYTVSMVAASAQTPTVLGGDHLITGDLSVGTTGTTGNLLVNGDTYEEAPPGLKVTGNGGVVFTGTNAASSPPETGAGTRFMWYPGKAALRAGNVNSSYAWSGSNIGSFSVAFGDDSVASGYASFAAGNLPLASGMGSVAFGDSTVASGDYSFAAGYTATAEGYASFAMGELVLASSAYSAAFGSGSIASNNGAFAAGETAYALGQDSAALGGMTIAEGGSSFAAGEITYALGYASVSLGYYNTSVGEYSFSMGKNTVADAYNVFVIGRNNEAGGDNDNWVETDPLFEVGNGTGNPSDPPEVQNRNALTVYKNGNVIIPKRQGDILMGEFGNPE